MMHATEGTLLALMDGELAVDERAALERHLEACAVCAAEVDSIREASAEFASAVRTVDVPPRLDDAHAAFTQRSRHREWSGEIGRSLRRAAILVLAVAGVASASIPGSPVRDLVLALQERLSPSPEPTDVRTVQAPAGGETESTPSGVSILPVDGRVGIVLREPAPGVEVRVRLADSERAAVRTDGDAGARFRISPGRIEVVGMAGGTLHIELPSGVHSAAVRIDGDPYLVKEGAQLRVLAPAADTAGTEVIFHVGP